MFLQDVKVLEKLNVFAMVCYSLVVYAIKRVHLHTAIMVAHIMCHEFLVKTSLRGIIAL